MFILVRIKMCWNEPVSWTSLGFGLVFSFFLFQEARKRKNNKLYALTFLWVFVLLMQFWEALMHRDNGKCGKMGKFATHGAYWSTVLQPIALILLLIVFNKPHIGMIQFATIIIALFYLGVVVYEYVKNPIRCKRSSCNHIDLYWWRRGYLMPVLYYIVLLLGFSFMQGDDGLRNFTIIFLLITSVISAIFYRKGGMPSMWCWFAVAGPLATLLYIKSR